MALSTPNSLVRSITDMSTVFKTPAATMAKIIKSMTHMDALSSQMNWESMGRACFQVRTSRLGSDSRLVSSWARCFVFLRLANRATCVTLWSMPNIFWAVVMSICAYPVSTA